MIEVKFFYKMLLQWKIYYNECIFKAQVSEL